ncbi:MAG TPA: 3-hydroxybutyrate oligomer hydrolase family protein [Burkholderiaceae bacterium]|nr:3-hydroxybutyrate oligomer hydrolase family protein [Burkholderiaceae bacterium]HPE01385.1 3-hydroxybutyrate oligomer hydrolase family protein [Burkholderiaceae bacterium]
MKQAAAPARLRAPLSLMALALLAACGGGDDGGGLPITLNERPTWLGTISTASYDGTTNDLLTAGLGKTGLAAAAPAVTDASDPTQLRRLAIHTNYRAIVDITANGGYGTLYGPNVTSDGQVTTGEGRIAGIEYIAYADDGTGKQNVTLMVQVPSNFNPAAGCIVSATSSGSRGVYGAIGSAGEWGLKRGCAVAYADKGSGNGVHDLAANTVNLLRGERAAASTAGRNSNFTADVSTADLATFNGAWPNRVAVKHAHSQQNPEKDWGRDTLRAIEFAFYVLNETYAPLTPLGQRTRTVIPGNTTVIASSVSNGAGAALAAAEQDSTGLIDGVAVTEPNVAVAQQSALTIRRGSLIYTDGSKPLYDYFTYANLMQPCAALSAAAVGSPFAFTGFNATAGTNRCTALAAAGLISGATLAERAADAMNKLYAYGWEPDTALLQASHYQFATPAIAMTYANSYGRFSVLDNLCGLSFAFTGATGGVIPATAALATIFGTGNGVPPSAGINIVNNLSVGGPVNSVVSVSQSTGVTDFNVDAALCQRALWVSNSPNALRVRNGVNETLRSANLRGKPAIIVHGRNDTLVPVNFSSRPYFARNQVVEGGASRLSYIEVTNAQHFDSFLSLAGYDNRFIPLHVYFNRAMDAMWATLRSGTALPPSQVVRTTPRGGTAGAAPAITAANVPAIAAAPAASDRISFGGGVLVVPD